jgi:heptosyltransferase-2
VQATAEKTAVVLPNHLGDVVMATPALRALRQGRPGNRISAVVRADLAPLLSGTPWIDDLVPHPVYAAESPLARLRARWKLARSLAPLDTVIVLPNSWSATVLAAMTGARCRVGYDRRRRGWLLTQTLKPRREGGRFVPTAMERYYLDLITSIGCPDTGTHLELPLDPEAEARCEQLFAAHDLDGSVPLVCLAPGAAFGPSKIWPPEYVGRVASELRAEGSRVALVHAPGEQALADQVAAAAGPGLLQLGGAGMDLALLKSVLSRARLLISNDAGARHVAAAFDVPTLVLMGPTSLEYTNLNLKLTKLLREPVSCSPCQLKVCPIDHRCMTRLLPERVLDEARAALGDPGWHGDLHLEPPS